MSWIPTSFAEFHQNANFFLTFTVNVVSSLLLSDVASFVLMVPPWVSSDLKQNGTLSPSLGSALPYIRPRRVFNFSTTVIIGDFELPSWISKSSFRSQSYCFKISLYGQITKTSVFEFDQLSLIRSILLPIKWITEYTFSSTIHLLNK